MAVRWVVCACLFVGVSATPAEDAAAAAVVAAAAPVYSEVQFKKKYDIYVLSLDAAEVKRANAQIVASTIPTQSTLATMHRWYHDLDTAEQARATAVMDKAHVARPAAFPIANCLVAITAAQAAGADQNWAAQYDIYNKILAEKTGIATKGTPVWTTEDVTAWSCLNALSGADKESTIQAGLRAKLFGIFKTQAGTDALTNAATLLTVSTFVSGTLGVVPGANEASGSLTQPMYSQADAALRREMMQHMVTNLNKFSPAL